MGPQSDLAKEKTTYKLQKDKRVAELPKKLLSVKEAADWLRAGVREESAKTYIACVVGADERTSYTTSEAKTPPLQVQSGRRNEHRCRLLAR